jgi:hypothetical protein
MKGRYDGENNPFYGRKHSQETKDMIKYLEWVYRTWLRSW